MFPNSFYKAALCWLLNHVKTQPQKKFIDQSPWWTWMQNFSINTYILHSKTHLKKFTSFQRRFNTRKSTHMIHHVCVLKDRNHMIITVGAGKDFDKFQHPSTVKALDNPRIWWAYLNIIETADNKPTSSTMLNGEKPKACPLSTKICPLHSLPFNIVLEVLPRRIRQEKETKDEQIEEEEVFLFSDEATEAFKTPRDNSYSSWTFQVIDGLQKKHT